MLDAGRALIGQGQPSRVAALTALKLGGDVAEANERARAVGGRALLGFEAPGGEQWQRSR